MIPSPPSSYHGAVGNEPQIFASSSSATATATAAANATARPGSRRGIMTGRAAVAMVLCRRRRSCRYCYFSSWSWCVATIILLTRLPSSNAAFHPSSLPYSHWLRIMKIKPSSSSALFSSSSSGSESQFPLLDPCRSRRRQRLSSSLELFAIRTSNLDSSSGIPIAGTKAEVSDNNGKKYSELLANQLLQQQQQQSDQSEGGSVASESSTFTSYTLSDYDANHFPSLLTLQQLQKYKTNKDIETAIVRLGRKGRTAEALQLYHAVWKLDELRQAHKEEKEGSEQQQLQILSSQDDLLPILFKSKLRPTTRLMNSAIDACARSSPQQISSSSITSSLLPPSPTSAAQSTKSRTRLALDIFHSGTSSWWPDSNLSSTTLDTTKKRKKKHGGALSPNVYTFGALLACCARDGDISTSLELLSILEEGTKYPDVELNDVIYSTVISACANANVNVTGTLNNKINSDGRGIPNNVKVALDVLNRGIRKLYQRTAKYDGDGRNVNDGIVAESSSSSSSSTTTATRMIKMMGVVGYNAVISTMSRAGEWKMAVQLLGEMILHSSAATNPSSSSPIPPSLLLQRTNPNFAPMELLRDDIMSCPQLLLLPPNVNANTTSDSAASSENTPRDYTNGIVVPKPDEVTFGTVLAACERSGEWETLLNVAKAATEYGVKLDGMALTSVLHSCQQLGLADEALEYLELMKRLGDDVDETIESYTDTVGKGVSPTQQHDIRITNGRHRKGAKQALRGPDGVAYRLAISACARAPGGQRWQDGIRLLREMKDVAAARKLAAEELSTSSSSSSSKSKTSIAGTDCAPDVMAYTAAIAGCSEAGEYIHAISLISEMRREGIQPNVVTFSAVINACATASAKLARRRGDEEDNGVIGASRFMYESTAGLEGVRLPMNRALRLLEAMKSANSSVRPNIVTYNAAIRACAEGFNLEGAFELLRQLKEDGMEPTIVTYGSLMTACERVGDVEAASRVFRMVKDEGKMNKEVASSSTTVSQEQTIQVNEIIYGAAISCCRKAQQPERALFLLRRMIDEKLAPNTATFNTVIAALAEGKGLEWEKALAVYRVMRSKHAPPGVMPNRKTYNILIRCLSSNLQPGYAESLLLDMRKDGFIPDVDLYTMTVRSYERCGNPMKALGLMESMREMGYDFYNVKVLDEAFKNGVKILNRMGKGFSVEGGNSVNTDVDGRTILYALSEESIDFDDYD